MKALNVLATLTLLAGGIISEPESARGQGPPFQQGWGVATCFSGYNASFTAPSDAPVVGTINLNPPYPNPIFGNNWMPPMYHGPDFDGVGPYQGDWTSENLGQVFGIAVDNDRNIYVAASSAYGDFNGSSTAWGPGGPGAIYRLSGVNGMISNFITSRPHYTPSNITLYPSSLPNGDGVDRGVGLGDLAYSSKYNRLYVTNMENGEIATIEPVGPTGIIRALYDPAANATATPGTGANANSNPKFNTDPLVDGFAPRGDRLWALGYNPVDDRLYYGVWMEDAGNSTATTYNVIRSLQVGSNGNPDPATERFEILLPNWSGNYSMPPSDIAFTSGGKMAIAERSMSGNATPSAHASRVLQYVRVSGNWTLSQQMWVGGSSGTNAAGGVDYAYRRYDVPSGQNVDCDSMLWMTGDFLRGLPSFSMVYGLQGTPTSTVGATLANYWTNSYFIDLNGVPGTQDKTQIGDVEIFRDRCGIPIPAPLNCDSLNISFTDVNDSSRVCCKMLTLFNGYQSGYFSGIKAEVITPGVSFSSTSVSAPAGWGIGTLNFSTVVWNAPAPGIPAGQTSGLKFCLDIGTTTSQKVVVSWIGKQGAICRDTLSFECVRTNTEKCIRLDSAKIACTSIGTDGRYTFTYSFSLTNLSVNDIDQSELFYLSSGVTITLSPLSFTPPIAPGGSRAITLTITGPAAQPNTGICFGLVVHDVTTYGVPPNERALKTWCCTDTICIVLPECLDCCKGFRFGAVQRSLTYDKCGGVKLATIFNPGPSAIVSASATIVSASLRQQCPVNKPTGRIFGDVVGGLGYGGLNGPSFSTPPIEAGYSREIKWGTNPSGVVLSGSVMTLNMIFPAPPAYFPGKPYCRDTLRFCVRYRFTDATCRTCDTLICYKIIRNPQFLGCVRDRGLPLGPFLISNLEGVPDGRTESEKSDAPSALLGADQDSAFASIEMSSDDDGVLTLNIPPNDPEAGPEGALSVVGLDFESQFGVHVVSLKDDGSGTQASVVENVARLDRYLPTGARHTFTVKFDNYAKLRSFSNRVGLRYLVASDLADTLIGDLLVTARTPGGKGGDTLTRDVTPGEQRKDVRTYALKFTSGNSAGDSIASVVIRARGGARILAIGPGSDSTSATLRAYAGDSTGARWLLTAPTENQTESAVATGQSIGPIYVTVEGAGSPDAVFEYATVTATGDTVSKGEITVREFTSGIRGIDDGGNAVTTVSLADCHPNPLTGVTTITFRLATSEPSVWLVVSDVSGREVAQPMSGTALAAGEHRVVFDAAGLPSGVYYYTLRTRGSTQTRTMQVVR